MGGDDYVIDGDLVFNSTSSALKFYQEQYHKKKEWQGLTGQEIADLHHEIKVKGMGAYKTEDIYRATEAKLKEKNT